MNESDNKEDLNLQQHSSSIDIIIPSSRITPRGSLIVFEGLDRCGKSTQVELLKKYIESQSMSVVTYKFPNRDHSTKQPITT